jgi:pilus assembly protein CpaE
MAEGRNSVIISIFSTSSGNGKTVTAINLAAGLANEGYAVCLVDLDIQFGDVTTYLKLNPKYTITDAQMALSKGSNNFDVLNYVTEYSHTDENGNGINFFVLPHPAAVFDAYVMEVPIVERIINSLKWFDFVVVDMNAAFSALNLAILDLSTIINYLGVVDFLPSVKNYKVGYDTLIRFEYEESKIRLVENRSNSQKLISGEDVERLIGEKFFHRLPNDFRSVSKSVREGLPLMFSAPDSDLAKSFNELAREYTGRSKTESDEAVQEKQGFLSKIFNKFFS